MLETIFSWQTVYVLLLIMYVPCCLGLIAIVLLQKGKNMGFAGAFGVNPGGDTVLGPRASRSLPVRMTYFMAAAFMTLCVLFFLIEGRRNEGVAPDKVNALEAAALKDLADELDELGVGVADDLPGQGEFESVPVDAAVDGAGADEGEPTGVAGDVSEVISEGETQAEIESMPGEDAP